MPEEETSTQVESMRTIPQRVWRWLKAQVVQDVPEADALCAYDCRKQQCNEEEWATCDRRINKAAGELWPEPDAAPQRETIRSAAPSKS